MNTLTGLVIAFLSIMLVTEASVAADYIGSSRCAQCHKTEVDAWRGSHHDLAMAEASTETVLGNFNDAEFSAHGITSRFYHKNGKYFVRTDGPDGKLHDYAIRYTFGWYPLQQYLIEFPRGHVQSLGLAWDSRPKADGGQRWFHLYPEENMDSRHRLHWTQREQSWNYQCAECHSTNLQKNYNLETDSYRTTWSEIDVACEACHGPGSKHAAWAERAKQDPAKKNDADKGMVVDLSDRDGGSWVIDDKSGKPRRTKPRENHAQIELCARCHSRRGQIWADYEYGKPLGNTHRLALLDEHLYFPDGQIKDEVYVYGSFIQSRMYQAGVTCNDCHEPHSLQLQAKGNALCSRCHLPARYDTQAHHHHEVGSAGAACANCHMPQRNYMVIDARADHSMRVPRPDLSVKLGTPNACTTCHADRTADWATKAVDAWYPESRYRGPHYGETLHAALSGSPDAAQRLSALAADASQPDIVRATAINYLRSYAEPQQLPLIQTLLNDKDPLIRASAVHFLEVTDIRTRVDQGWLLLDDPDRVVRLEATRILAPLLRQQLPEQFRSQLERAIKEYMQAQQVNAERPETHINLGLIAIAMGDAQNAEQEYRTALHLEPTFVPGYINLADLYRQLGQDAAGEKLLQEGIEAAGDNADLQHALGLLLVRQKRLNEALNYLRQAAKLAEDNPRYIYVYALALEGAGDKQQALTVLTQANLRHPGNSEIMAALEKLKKE
jgi:tetratricopeptide (TPR) repeat protein